MVNNKRHLTKDEEFQIMKLVMDKFLWLGVIILAFGFYKMITAANIWFSLAIMAAGIIIMLLFSAILVREFNFMKV